MRAALTLVAFVAMAAATAPLAGCAYDYAQHTDRVSYASGNAVKANLEMATIDPSKRSTYSTKGLGKNGIFTKTVPAGVIKPEQQ
jgi:hypothetical protein